MPSAYVWRAPGLLGPDPGLHVPPPGEACRPLQSQSDGLTELPGEGVTSSGLDLVQRGPLATLPFDPTYLWTPEGPG